MIHRREIAAAGLGAFLVAAYMALILASGRVDPATFGRLLLFYTKVSFTLWAVLGGLSVIGQLIVNSRRSENEPFLLAFVSRIAVERWQRDRCASLVWPPVLFATLLASFNAFKQMILPLAGFSWDPFLLAADRALLLGVDPWRLTHAIFGSPEATILLDRAYHGWFVPMSVGLIACSWLPGSTFRLRTQYTLSYIGVWIGIGSVFAFLMPSAGPCFYDQYIGSSNTYDALLQSLVATEAVSGEPLTALAHQAILVELQDGNTLTVGGGISAMPSVHNALAALFTLAAFKVNRTAGWFVSAYAAVIWVGSIHLGWHYALDGLVAYVLTGAIWVLCGWLVVFVDVDAKSTQLTPALA